MKDWLSRKVRFVKASVEEGKAGYEARVELERAGSGKYVGTAHGPGSGMELFRAGAEAAAQAVEQAADTPEAGVAVSDLQVVKLFGQTLVLVCVSARLRSETRTLYGVCQVQEDPAAAAALAVLSATNRVFDLA